MTTSLPHRRRLLCRSVSIASLVALSLMGCASVPGHGAKTQEALLQRATAYWQAMKDNDRVTAWGYEELSKKPDWTLQGYLKRGGLVYDEVKVLSAGAIEGDRAAVHVKMTYSVPAVRVKNITAERQDQWIWIDGQWYHADRPAVQ
ncbi:hypothetical protein [Acidovorax sp. SDU_ACID1]|uniref:hypothetical protein n=1 Tax=Acidovorax sp. SDU_ACID1 TaxID=3136632 RepID=UPI003873996F